MLKFYAALLLIAISLTAASVEGMGITVWMTVGSDGSCRIKYVVVGFSSISVELLGEPLNLKVSADSPSFTYAVKGGVLYGYGLENRSLIIEYSTYSLTHKREELWFLSFSSKHPVYVYFPPDVFPFQINGSFRVKLIENEWYVYFENASSVSIAYVVLPGRAKEEPLITYALYGVGVTGLSASIYAIYRYRARKSREPEEEAGPLDERDRSIISLLKERGSLSAAEIQRLLGIPKTPLYRKLNKLVKMGYLEVFREKSVRKYRLRKT